MKYKTNEEPQSNSFLEDILDLLVLNKQFNYAIYWENEKKNCPMLKSYSNHLI